ncbi:putative mitochondrial protein [Andalucia godoyi]|uniref:Putative mitochondrial protein n=1 Tax=Andalucia godoyi TaxID=505711 RepID=A0A8K0AH03_ANDGO|nr:putative mitochondrial protein [Andalucia godoyi]|eukprot:ANDGO_08773.mRNA.1 putative mitochondrial protein
MLAFRSAVRASRSACAASMRTSSGLVVRSSRPSYVGSQTSSSASSSSLFSARLSCPTSSSSLSSSSLFPSSASASASASASSTGLSAGSGTKGRFFRSGRRCFPVERLVDGEDDDGT